MIAGLLLGCRSSKGIKLEAEDAARRVAEAERELQSGDSGKALSHLSEVRSAEELDPDLRERNERLIDEAARQRFAELADAPSGELEELFEEAELPDRIRARAGILAAERMLAEDSRISSFRMVKKVDEAIPAHVERALAGDVVARAGLSLVRDDRRYNLLFHYRARGIQALEYLIVNYPLEPRCPEAYYALSEVYEKENELDLAIERSEDLLLYHPGSAHAVAASARLPYLRLLRLGRDDYDRSELLRAQSEIALWLSSNPGHELASWVHSLESECRTRIVRSDLILARYYARVDSAYGARLHAARARTLAIEGGLDREAKDAEEILARFPEAPSAPTPSQVVVP